MNASDAASAYASLYAPSAESLRISLPEMAEGLSAQLHELYARPSVVAAESLAANLGGAQRACLKFREALLREGTGIGDEK